MAKKSAHASIKEVAFDCPHCGAYTTHTWFDLHATNRPNEHRTPFIATEELVESARKRAMVEPGMTTVLQSYERLLTGRVFLQTNEQTNYVYNVDNLNISKCFSCGQIAVWVFDQLLSPKAMTGPEPTSDLPPDVLQDYEEASRVVGESPRGTAALLRLGIQKLCVVLGGKGERIDDDIASLVKKGLLPLVQKSLDAVRVIGNEAVHAGTLDLKDDRDTATKLFQLVNIISEQMISNPKHVEDVYGKIPESKRQAIEKRDGKK